jgi:MOSC domain-containing protein YiiM
MGDTARMTVTADRDFEPFLVSVQTAPRDAGRLKLIVRRPAEDEREVLTEALLDPTVGLVGDSWHVRGSSRTADGGPNPQSQVTLISTRVLEAIEPDQARWPLAGDQLYVDFDLAENALPPGTRIAIGSAVLEVSEQPHTGCAKFSARFGSDALRWINSPVGRELRMRGMNARVASGGTVRTGDALRVI